MTAAAKHLTPVVLELGGKSPVIVDSTADIEVNYHSESCGRLVDVFHHRPWKEFARPFETTSFCKNVYNF